ncbi:cysteine--tRNA ligase [Candidatus Venteria ishoeyi]|uniref:Cysteine--tRNA ligase n=1 Tax=Candidatus Venteria ishoeyi TaxID=1899563 RepID=A0A1H6FDM4_9GAMM|nr:cysteine--tRNA ligase [Candidatus Venteria ishoeyi]MDM8545486.1 cysteine--tRNA ligase [Candidatus Venteria ishoeyi]SEH08172.1 Cysteine--tRNA ligase [Candidatus Venteria ishoeyi]
MLNIYNTLTREKAPFQPMEDKKVRIYVCGMTVYDYCHVGHARVMVAFDVIVRYLREQGYDVTYVRNITDIDDKIIARAQENGEDFSALTARFIQAMHEDAAALGVLPPDQEPRATDSLDLIIEMIQSLFDQGYAYVAKDGDVCYTVNKFKSYGQLSGKNLEDLQAGTRVEVNTAKNNPLDFVLWKMAKPGEPGWDSPWGKGRPGWHIECSAMSTHCLGNHFDIHGGGMDLQFPHHENEIAQSEAATGEKFVDLWMHNGFVRINEEKMSKSLGNFFTVREVLKAYHPEVVRYFILTSQYRSPLNYSDQQLDNAQQALTRLYTALRGLPNSANAATGNIYQTQFHEAMDDDFNTPEALAVLFEMAREINKLRTTDMDAAAALGAQLCKLSSVMGLLENDPEQFLKNASPQTEGDLSDEAIEQLIIDRKTARTEKDWAKADSIRGQLDAANVILEDGADGTTWRRK